MNQDFYVCFIDFQKVFDKVRHHKLVEIIREKDVDSLDIRIIKNLYWNQRPTARIEKS